MEIEFIKTDETTLKVITTNDPVVIEKNYDLDTLLIMKQDQENTLLLTIQNHEHNIYLIQQKLSEIESLIVKCNELGIKSKLESDI